MIKTPYEYAFVYDFETGGLNSTINAITELALVVIDLKNLEIVEQDSWLIKPYGKVYEELALEKTKISLELLNSEGEGYSEVFNQFMEYVEEYTEEKKRPIVCGHNIDGFDNAIMKTFLEDHNQRWDRTFNNHSTIDTLKLSRLRFLELENYRLETVCKQFGIELEGAHRALNDTKSNALLLIKLLKLLRV